MEDELKRNVDERLFDRAYSNLQKVSIFLFVIGLGLIYIGFFRYDSLEAQEFKELLVIVRVSCLVMFYLGIKIRMISNYLVKSLE